MPPKRLFSIFTALCAVLAPLNAPFVRAQDLPISESRTGEGTVNNAIVEILRSMPAGGHYSASQAAFTGLGRAVGLGTAGLQIDPREAQPSFCSGATYLVFVQVLDQLSRQGVITLDAQTQRALLVNHQKDGQGVWGRWNANGPGTARLFTELGLGHNFTDFAAARPGDFMKIFWTEEIGQKEHGHSVIYLGSDVVGGKEFVHFWSSNMASNPGDLSGYGFKIVPRTKIARCIFSRLDHPGNIARISGIAGTDAFLASLLSRRVTIDEVRRMCDL